MKKILILTASTGQGHNQAADSLCAAFNSKGFEVIKYDFINENTKLLKAFIVGGYDLLASKFPLVYGKLYKITDVKKLNKTLKYPFIVVENRTLKFIQETKPDIIVGTHPLSVNVVCRLKKDKLIDVPFISIVTDFKAHYAYIDKYVDAYITASEYTKEQMCSEIPASKIFPYGIPIRQEFLNAISIDTLEDTPYFNVLLMGGSMGLKAIDKVLEQIIHNKHKLKITVVCGNNTALKETLENKYTSLVDKELTILGFTKEVAKLMEKSNIIITKPGGLTVSEAIAKHLPMLIPFAIPGQEEENAEFLETSGAAIYIKDITEINDKLDYLIENPKVLNKIKENLKVLSKNYSIDNIVNLCERLINK